MLLSAGLTWTLSEIAPPSRGVLAKGRCGSAADGRRPADGTLEALASRFFAWIRLPLGLLQAVAPVGPSVNARSAAEAAAITSVRTLPLPNPLSPSEYYRSSKRERSSKVAGRGPAVVDATGGGGPSRPTAPGGAANDPGAASSRGDLKTGPGGP